MWLISAAGREGRDTSQARALHRLHDMNDNQLEPTPSKMPSGKVGYALLWLLGIPIPVLLGFYFLRGCN